MGQRRRPNILFIMGDDIGWYKISACNVAVMGYQTPNIDLEAVMDKMATTTPQAA